ncbi:ESPR-type extended signal peptide-containing protein [Burkholderia stabilis]|uniref:ESPR-type extended signal peptide-containing protein n=1 Tax=Burkholderia stabilis TaxID=95485 RepID=UPI001F237ED7|nr:ESPR-type extended signal peptide-containing protein [Burkholderia stabilis]
MGAWVAASELDRARGKRVASSSSTPERAAHGCAAAPGGCLRHRRYGGWPC